MLAALQPLNLIDLLSFGPSLLGAVMPSALAGLTAAGLDLRWVRVFRWVCGAGFLLPCQQVPPYPPSSLPAMLRASPPSQQPLPRAPPYPQTPRALRLLRLSLLGGNLPHMRLSKGALLAGAVNVPLLWLLASVVSWLFTAASIVQVLERIAWHDALYFVVTVSAGASALPGMGGSVLCLVIMVAVSQPRS